MRPDTTPLLDEDAPYYVSLRSVQDILREYTAETLPNRGEYIVFDVDGFDRSRLFLNIYMRPYPSITEAFDFPLTKIGLRGTAVYPDDDQEPQFPSRNGLHGTGAFRSLIRYLERELPGRGFKRIFIERLENDDLREVAKRYGFVRIGKAENLNYVKLLVP